MSPWQKTPLADAYWFQEGPGVRKWQFRDSGVKLLNVANITKDGVLDLSKTNRHLAEDEISKKYSHFLASEGDLVIASSGISFDTDGLLRTRGAFVKQQHLPLCLNTSTIRFKAKEGISTLDWLRYWLDSVEFREQITRLVTGSAQQNFGPSHLKATKISLPQIAEQKRIVKILDEADALRKLRAQSDSRTAALIPALFHEMFGDPLKNPKGWPQKKLAELCNKKSGVKAGPFGSALKKDSYTPKGPRVYGQEQVIAGDFSIGDYHISQEKFNEMSAYSVAPGDLLISLVGTIGKAVVVPQNIEQGIINPRLLRIRPHLDVLNPYYLKHLIKSETIVRFFSGIANGVTMGVLNARLLKTLLVSLPPLSLQKTFVERITEVHELEAIQTANRNRLEALFQSLLHCAFNGTL